MSIRSNVVAYHVNDKDRCEEFIRNNDYLVLSPDTMWLGYGMYFWDNDSNADYWVNQKKQKDLRGKEIAKARANIFTDKLLDFTDKRQREMFAELWSLYEKKEGIESGYIPLGVKIDKLFTYFDYLRDEFTVIKVHGNYKYTPKDNLIRYNIHSDKCEPITHIKTIYSVMKSEYVCNREIMEVFNNNER